MKLYIHSGRYYEKQADCPDRNFEVVEFPFSATPKADFVAWMNDRDEPASEHEELPVDSYVQREAERKAAQPVHEPRAPRTADGVMDWLLDDASNAEIEQVFSALGARFHEMKDAA